MKSIRKIPVPRLAAMAAGVCVVVGVVWFMVSGNAAGRAGESGTNAPPRPPGVAPVGDATSPPWASEEQKAKAAEREARRRRTLELYAELTKGLPELQPKLEGIPEFEVNGYERLRALAKAREEELPEVPTEFMEMLWEARTWDSLAVKAFLRQHTELLAELAAISRVPSGEIDWGREDIRPWDVSSGKPVNSLGYLLCLAVMDAAFDRRPDGALEWMEVAVRLSNHVRAPKDIALDPYIMGMDWELGCLLLAPKLAKLAAQSPGIQARLDLLFESHRLTPADMAHHYRGDTVSRWLGFILPAIQDSPESFERWTAEELNHGMRMEFEFTVRELAAMRAATGFVDLIARLDELRKVENSRGGLPFEEEEPLYAWRWEPRGGVPFWIRHETRRQMALAAVRLARDDRSPETILAEITASEPEPRKLHYDPVTRTLTSEPFLTETEKTSIQVP